MKKVETMKYIITLSILLVTILPANKAQEGKKLYTSANCQKCHLMGKNFDSDSINKDDDLSQVKNKKGIHKWVESCDNYFNVGWFPEEIDKVTEYLNNTHYKFKK